MSVLDSIKEKAKADVKHILLPEGSEERTVQAARIITDEKIAKVTLLGDEEEIKKVAEKFNVCLCGIDIINPLTDPDFEHYANGFYEPRNHKEHAVLCLHDDKGRQGGRHGFRRNKYHRQHP